ncbi:MAG: D-alanine--D-alanine ligase [Planctomycetia bacterium]|nr:D-alanine--D-alanine ligase [Planctomycetia bacterium]
MKVVVLYHESGEDATVEDRDVLVQRDAVAAALEGLGHETTCVSCTLDLATAKQRLISLQPDVVFNLVESLGGTDRLMTLATMLLDALHIPYTGTHTDAMLATSNKLTAKERLYNAGLPTPAWLCTGADEIVAFRSAKEAFVRGANDDNRWILKPVLEHASFGMDDDAVVYANDMVTLETKLNDREQQIGRPLFAERFIEGREFNLSLLSGQVLPPAEIDFSSFPPDKPRIVNHQAKWDQDSFEYQQTPRSFDFVATDELLLQRVSELAQECWELFDLSGYARVDFRVDRNSHPWILEINANPCLSPDAGFAAAVLQAGFTYDDAIQRIIDEAVNATPLLRIRSSTFRRC